MKIGKDPDFKLGYKEKFMNMFQGRMHEIGRDSAINELPSAATSKDYMGKTMSNFSTNQHRNNRPSTFAPSADAVDVSRGIISPNTEKELIN